MDYQNEPTEHEEEPYGFMERELIFKLLASHALVDAGFFEELRRDPEAAATQLHIGLTEGDLNYLRTNVEWERIARHANTIRESLHLDLVTHSW